MYRTLSSFIFAFYFIAVTAVYVIETGGDYNPSNIEGIGGVVVFSILGTHILSICVGIYLFDGRYARYCQVTTKAMASRIDINLAKFAPLALLMMIFCTLLQLFFFGGTEVIAGELNRGENRTTHAAYLGIFRTVFTATLPDFLVAIIAILYFSATGAYKKYSRDHIVASFCCLFVVLASLFLKFSTGFKSAAIETIAIVTLAYVLARPNRSVLKPLSISLVLCLISFGLIGIFFDEENFELLLTVYFYRFTYGIMEVPYYFITNNINWNFLDWCVTFLNAFGKNLLLLISADNQDFVTRTNLGQVISLMMGYDSQDVRSGLFNYTVTAFGEGYFAAGVFGVIAFGLFISFLLAKLSWVAEWAHYNCKVRLSGFILVYASTVVFSWINGGSVARLFNFPFFLGIGISALLVGRAFVYSKAR